MARAVFLLLSGLLLACQAAPSPAPLPGPSRPPASPATPMATPIAPAGFEPFVLGPGEARDLSAGILVLSAAGEQAGSATLQGVGGPGPSRPARRMLALGLGDRSEFWIQGPDFTPEQVSKVQAVLRLQTEHAHFYLEEGLAEAPASLQAIAEAFESRIRPRVSDLLGPEAGPGVDGDPRLHVVFSDRLRVSDVLGYFWAPDAIPRSRMPEGFDPERSNQRELIVLSAALLRASPVQAGGALAHELAHLIAFSRKGPQLQYRANEATWLDEGIAMAAMDHAGFGLEAGERNLALDVKRFLDAPERYSLTEWASNPEGQAFGQCFLFVRFLLDRHGESVLRAILDEPRRGIEALEAVLRPRGDSFEALFRDWTLANWLSGSPRAEGTPYRYAHFDPHGRYAGIQLSGIQPRPLSGAPSLRPWGTRYLEIDAPRRLSAQSRLLGTLAPP